MSPSVSLTPALIAFSFAQLNVLIKSILAHIEHKSPGMMISPSPIIEKFAILHVSGKTILMGKSNSYATVTIISVPKTNEKS